MTAPVPSLDVAAIRARAEAATPGPWEASYLPSELSYPADEYSVITSTTGDTVAAEVDSERGSYESPHAEFGADAQFIAHARTDIPLLLSALESADARVANTFRAERDEARAALARIEALHQPGKASFVDAGGFCTGCNYEWPCPTIAALRGDES